MLFLGCERTVVIGPATVSITAGLGKFSKPEGEVLSGIDEYTSVEVVVLGNGLFPFARKPSEFGVNGFDRFFDGVIAKNMRWKDVNKLLAALRVRYPG